MDAAPGPRDRLLREVARNEAELAQLEADHAALLQAAESSNADDEHDPEGATLAFEREQLTSIMARVRETIADQRQALADDQAGRYGRCDGCGRPIDPARLEVRPQARLCMDCARQRGR